MGRAPAGKASHPSHAGRSAAFFKGVPVTSNKGHRSGDSEMIVEVLPGQLSKDGVEKDGTIMYTLG
jgi:hypothetical protein